MSLFIQKPFISHSGNQLNWKVECDNLTDEDIKTMVEELIPDLMCDFGSVVGVPSGGIRMAKFFEDHITPGNRVVLIVDDVFTTGHSMNAMRETVHNSGVKGVVGAVLFARGPYPSWITPFWSRPE